MAQSIPELNAALAGRYVLERELGQGAMATVYLARDVRHDRKVAVKVLRPELAAVLGAERFLNEIQVTAGLQHPRILPLFESGNAGGLLFYVMPYVDGESLRDRLNHQRELPVDEAVKIALAIASGLEYAHRRGVVHRDIKPENILLQDGEPLVADFGIAVAVSQAGGKRLTETGLSIGTPQYMSPEQAIGDRAIDARSDIYALGATTYEMLVGEPPHPGNSAQAIIARIITDDPAPVSRARPIVPMNVDAAVRTALAKSPADRFPSAAAFASALTNPAFTMGTKSTGGDSASLVVWKRLAGVLTTALLLSIGLSLWGWLRPAARRSWPVSRYSITLGRDQGLVPALAPRVAVSPDGTRFVYVGPGERGTQLWVRERSQLTARPLAGTEGAVQPAFSPDGQQVAFITFVPTPRVNTVAFDGRPPVTVATVAGTPIESGGVAWGPDNFLYVTAVEGLARVRAQGGALEPVTRLDTTRRESKHVWPEVLPGGRGVLFTVRHAVGTNEIAVVDLKTRAHRVLADGRHARYAASGQVLYVTRDGILMAAPFDPKRLEITGASTPLVEGVSGQGAADLALSREGTLLYVAGSGTDASSELVRVTRDAEAIVIDPTWQGDFAGPALSPDGRRLAIEIHEGDRSDVWIKQLDAGPLYRLTFGGGINFRPEWPDGEHVTFLSDRAGQQDLWIQRVDGSDGAKRLLDSERNVSEGFVSHDGRWVVFRTSIQDPGNGDVLARSAHSDTAILRLAATDAEEVMPALSPDGRWLAYVSNESGQRQIYVRPFPNAADAKWQVSTDGGTEPQWSHSGRELFYRDAGDYLIAVTVRSAPTFAVLESRSLFGPVGSQSGLHAEYAVAADDQSFLMIRPSIPSAGNALIVVENLFDELRAITGK